MIVCIDVDYREDAARGETAAVAACVAISSWDAPRSAAEYACYIAAVADYVPGQFYKRELPCILAVLAEVQTPIDVVVVDGYVFLDSAGSPGLGAYLHEALEPRVPVIGVAKTPFRADDGSVEVLRGESKRPLHVTAVGVDPERAAEDIRRMHGRFRLPTALKRVDRLCRDAYQAPR